MRGGALCVLYCNGICKGTRSAIGEMRMLRQVTAVPNSAADGCERVGSSASIETRFTPLLSKRLVMGFFVHFYAKVRTLSLRDKRAFPSDEIMRFG